MKGQQLTVLPDIHTDGVRRRDVGVRRFHGSAGIRHVKEEENRNRCEAEDGDESQSEDVGQEHELNRERKEGRSRWGFMKMFETH